MSATLPTPSHRPGAAALVAGALLGVAVPFVHPAHGAGYYGLPMTAGSHLLLFAAVLLVSLGLPALVATGAAQRALGRVGGALYFVGLWALDGSHGLIDGAVLPALAHRIPAVGHALHAGHASQDLLANGPMGLIVNAAIPCFALGSILLAVALWKARVLPRAVAAMLAVAWMLAPISFVVPALRAPGVALPYVALLAAGAMLLARRPAGSVAEPPSASPRTSGGGAGRATALAGWAAVAGGVAWLAKIGVIVATDGRVMTTGAAAWLMRAGLLAWALAAGAAALRLAHRRGVAARVAAVLASPIVTAASFMAVGMLAAAAVGTRGPAYLQAEIGILVIGALGLAAGAATVRRAASRRAARWAAGALLVAGVVAARPAEAQFGGEGAVRAYTMAQTHEYRSSTGAYDTQDVFGEMASVDVTDQSGSRASAEADAERFSVRATAFGAAGVAPYARAQAYVATDVWFLNANLGGTSQPLLTYFHGTMQRHSGTRGGLAAGWMTLRVRDGDGNLLAEHYERRNSNGGGEVAERFERDILIPFGYSRYRLELALDAEVQGYWEADFGSTGNMYLPTVAGVTWGAEGTAGSRQFVPAWARATPPATVAPEPATLGLAGVGLAALATLAAARRRRGE